MPNLEAAGHVRELPASIPGAEVMDTWQASCVESRVLLF